jgi:hypothetical protein
MQSDVFPKKFEPGIPMLDMLHTDPVNEQDPYG